MSKVELVVGAKDNAGFGDFVPVSAEIEGKEYGCDVFTGTGEVWEDGAARSREVVGWLDFNDLSQKLEEREIWAAVAAVYGDTAPAAEEDARMDIQKAGMRKIGRVLADEGFDGYYFRGNSQAVNAGYFEFVYDPYESKNLPWVTKFDPFPADAAQGVAAETSRHKDAESAAMAASESWKRIKQGIDAKETISES